MDTATQRTALESKQREVEAFLASDVAKELLADLKEQQEIAISILCDRDIDSIETFFRHVTAVGHLRGLRRVPGLLQDQLDDIKKQLKDLDKDEC